MSLKAMYQGIKRRREVLVALSSNSSGPTPAAKQQVSGSTVKIPRGILEVDNGKVLGFGAELSEDHPGFHDDSYKLRRVMLANQAKSHRIGEPIPPVEYSDAEVAVWAAVCRELHTLLPRHACKQYLRALPKFNFTPDRVPQLQELSDVLQSSSGWSIRPVAGLMHPRDFLAGLAFKTFHSTQYMRHPSRPSYTPEPDVVHELIGHVPMLADPDFGAMVQAIGQASLGVDDKQIWHLTKVYWYTVEFGVVREGGEIKAFGAGILSSFGELQHMAAGGAELVEFDPFSPQPKMSYKDGYQRRYYVLDSFESGTAKLRQYATSIRLPEELRGDASVA
eukprot:CAMPEP_0202921848 /NCGR_PEP_ID=MMETSP1392-20130828/77612_1 /ASSEMBLY_ACC=CAM_ASM_000868 /TAXON_ID=225041 /ORGANISM="Chlamydomonas chlamydogama, Strain SAG 11-48b" /LENGTH=334 /DNA_ID=CAMNT_0049615447 /DNA_START=129 /DNA_END=1134 /DNA_ORIENTATION=-